MSIAGAILLLFLFAAPGLFCGVYQKNGIPFRDMTKDGIAITPSSHFGKISTRDFYSVTVQFGDITYQLADDETQQSIFEDYRDVLNYFDDTVDFQLTFEVRRQNARKIMSDMTPEPLLNAIEELTVLNREITAKEEQLFNICMTICVYAKSQKKLDLKIDALRRVCQNALAEKSDFITSLLELIVGGQFGLTASERSIIDRAVRAVYIPFLENNPTLETMPMLSDLHNELLEYGEAAERVATSLELYGSQNLFNHRTNVDVNNRIVCFDIKNLGQSLKKIGMLVVQESVWGRVSINRDLKKTTRFYIDEFPQDTKLYKLMTTKPADAA